MPKRSSEHIKCSYDNPAETFVRNSVELIVLKIREKINPESFSKEAGKLGSYPL